MHPSLRSLAEWDRLSKAEVERLAVDLLVPGFTLLRVTECAQGDADRFVAFFQHRDGAEFTLLPGGKLVLGLEQPPKLDAAGEESWAESVTGYGFPAFDEYVKEVMLPERTVTLAPLLVETVARGVNKVIDEYDHEGLLTALKRDAFRLLTSDEWEHACAAGTRTLWRWGNASPTDEEPYGNVRFPELRKPNGFGLSIAQNPYSWEYVMEPQRMRGGDGGEAVCGGYGHVAAWLACASPYLWPNFDTDSYLDEGFVRRTFPLA
jgi:hypothetical protein